MTSHDVRSRKFTTVHLVAAAIMALASCTNDSTSSSSRPVRSSARLTAAEQGSGFIIASPMSGTVFYDTLEVVVSLPDLGLGESHAADGQLFVNGVATRPGRPMFRDGHNVYVFHWDADAVPAGDYELTVKQTLASGLLATTPPVTVTLRHTAVSLVGLVLNPRATLGEEPVTVTVTLSGPAPAGGVIIPIFPNEQPKAILPLSVTVPEGATTGTSSFTPQTVGQTTFVTAQANFRQVSKSDLLTITRTPGVQQLGILAGSIIVGGTTTTASVFLNQAFVTDSVITLASDDASVTVPATLTIPAGQTSGTFVVGTSPVETSVQSTIAATYPTRLTEKLRLWVVPPKTVAFFSIAPGQVFAGQAGTGSLSFSGSLPAAGATVGISCVLDSQAPPHLQTWTFFSKRFPGGASSGQLPIPTTARDAGFLKLCFATMNGTRTSSPANLFVMRNLASGNATFDATLAVPSCRTVGVACDSGGLIDGRANLDGGPEVHTPNTIGSSCLDDGASPFPDRGFLHYHYGSSLDRLKVSTLDGSALAAGKVVRVEATVWGSGNLDLFLAADATNPVWTFVERLIGGGDTQHAFAFSRTLTLPAGSLQAIRANFGSSDLTPQLCSTGGSSMDHDDLVFATDNGGPPTNIGPSVNAGPDQILSVLPTATLLGTVTDDGVPGAPALLTTTWSKLSGPGNVTFGDPAAASTSATFSLAGTYTLRLTASDGASSATDDLVVVVNASAVPNTAPAAFAGADQTITLPAGASLQGVVGDDGLPNPPGALVATWSQLSGPGLVSFGDEHATTTTAAFIVAGNYTLRLTVRDGALSTSDDLVITVNPIPPVNQRPVVSAGADRAITLPAMGNLVGTVSDDGLPSPPAATTMSWSQLSGPGTVAFGTPTAASTTVTFSTAGVYGLRLSASDGALSSADDVTVTVAATTIKVQYRAADLAARDGRISPRFNLVNTGSRGVPLSRLKIRYWYSIDVVQPQTVRCESAQIGCFRTTLGFGTVTPARPGADRYVEVGFNSAAGTLAAGRQTGEIRLRLNKNNFGDYDETNDYSYSSGVSASPPLSLVDWTRVTVYQDGVRIWGTEP